MKICNDSYKLYVKVVSLKVLQKLNERFKRVIYWEKYASKATTKDWNQYLGFLTNSSVLKLKIIKIHISDIFTDCKNKKKIMQ